LPPLLILITLLTLQRRAHKHTRIQNQHYWRWQVWGRTESSARAMQRANSPYTPLGSSPNHLRGFNAPIGYAYTNVLTSYCHDM
jgi:hypothetical protein